MLHLAKLAVGVRDVAHLRKLQTERAKERPPLRHRTRHFPRRAAEVLEGGSIYWVVAGAMVVRQRILDIVDDKQDDGSACAALVLHPGLVAVSGRLMRPFQGWRYLPPEDAPPDLTRLSAVAGEAALPAAMRRELRALGLI